MSELQEGKKAPAFSLKDKNSDIVALKDIDSDFAVVYFYPRDNTPGCTIEAKEFTADLKKFKKLGTTVIGISGGDEKSKTTFCTKHKLEIPLLSDPEGTLGSKYGAYGEKNFMGKKSIGFIRKTFVLDQKRNIVKIYHNVKAEGHSQEVLEYIRSLRK